jgi:ribonuclease HII
MRYGGIDEAGYGPTLGPLSIVAVAAEGEPGLDLARAFAGTGVKDSKAVHRPGDLAPLEQVALGGLAWLMGEMPTDAAAVFAALGESPADRDSPWMDGAASLRLPVAAMRIPGWRLAGLSPMGVRGRLIQPTSYNRYTTTSGNKAALELHHVGELLRWAADGVCAEVVVDRLGGRRFYGDALGLVWPGDVVAIEEEAAAASRYRIAGRRVSFLVGGDSASPFTALASCIAKYARELHMTLFNRHWCTAIPGLAPTAGYPEDARRWLNALGQERYAALGPALVRGWPNF